MSVVSGLGRRVNWAAVAAGSAIGVVGLAVAGAVVGLAGGDDDDTRLVLVVPLLVVALVGLAASGWLAARRTHRAPLAHAAAAALAAVVVVDVVVVVRQLASDEPIAWGTAGLWGLLAVAAGLTGGRRALRPRRSADSTG